MPRSLVSKKCERIHKVDQWRKSGKSARAWCRENHVVYTTFLGWRDRLKDNNDQTVTSLPANNSLGGCLKTNFIELKDPRKVVPGITLEYQGVKIHLSSEFDATTLKTCLDLLRGFLC